MLSEKIILIGLAGLSILLAGAARGQATVEVKNVKAWVSVERGDNGMVKLQPMCNSNEAMVVNYYLIVEKLAQGGSSVSKQGGEKKLSPGVEHSLGVVSINLGPADKCRVQLQVVSQGNVVAQEDFWVGPFGD